MKWLLFYFFAAAILGAGGCTTACDEAAAVLTRECSIEVGGDADVACVGERLGFSQCVLDHTQAACDWFYDSVVAEGNAFDRCVRAIPPD